MKHNQHHHSFRRRKHRSSIDGIVPSSGQLGKKPVQIYRPNKELLTPSLGDQIKQADGFHASRTTGYPVGTDMDSYNMDAELDEAHRLEDETVVIDDDFVKPKSKPKKHRRTRKILKRSIISIILLAIIIGGFLSFRLEKNVSKVFHGNILGLLHTTKLKGEDQGRVNILLAGNSSDDVGHNGAMLTDSIMLMSINTKNNSGYIVSIPRDLWVQYGTSDCSLGNSGKINAVYECGQDTHFHEDGYPDGGMGLLEKQVNKYFGTHINYYALIDYAALRDAVNAVGGVNFTVSSTDPRGIYDPSIDWTTRGPLVKLTNGTHNLTGQQALDLARARGDAYGSYGFAQADFTRTQNQRQLLLNLKSKILTFGVLSNPAKISSLLNVLGNNVQTDFHVDEIKRMYDISKLIPNDKIQSVGLADQKVNLVKTGTVGNQSVVVPAAGVNDFSKIQAYLRRVGSNDPLVKEAASAVILNGSDTAGLATKTSSGLTDRGMNILVVGDATTQQKTIVIATNNNNPSTKSYLEKKYGVTATNNLAAYPSAKYYTADFVIILGQDAASSQ